MKYTINLNLEPYSNVLIESDHDGFLSSENIEVAIENGLKALELKTKLIANRERELLVNEIELLMGEKEYDSLGLCEYLEVPNLMRETLLNCDTQKLRFVMDGLKQKPNRKE